MTEETDVQNMLWGIYQGAIRKHIATESSDANETEDEYRERAEKAGLVAVAEFVRGAVTAAACMVFNDLLEMGSAMDDVEGHA